MSIINRLEKYEGLDKDIDRCPSNPCITVREAIEIADHIAQLREQVAALTKERDDYKHDAHCCNIEFNDVRDSYAHFKAMSETQAEQIAALAEQNEKLRKALEAVSEFRFPHGDNCYLDPDHAYGNSCLCGKESLESLVAEALSIPDLATHAINRIKREGMLEAAEICQEVGEDGDGMAGEIWVERCRNAIRARADELYPEVKP